MNKTFSIRHFFREISPDLLIGYFEKKGRPFPKEPGAADPSGDQLYEYWVGLDPAPMRAEIEKDFCDLHAFMQMPRPLESILEEARFRKENPSMFPAFIPMADEFFAKLESLHFPEEKAFWVLTHHQPIFDNAYRFSSADSRAGKRFSTKRPTGFFSKPRDDDKVREELGESISEFYRAKGKGEGFQVDILDRSGVIYYFIYLEDVPRSGGIFQQGKYQKEILRDSFEVVFWFDPKSGELSTCARCGREDRQELERRFAELCLGNGELPALPRKPAYNLDLLKDPGRLLDVNHSDGFQWARVKSLKVFPPDSGFEIVIAARNRNEDARRLLTGLTWQSPSGASIPLSEMKVANVEIEIGKADNGTRGGTFSFNLFYPNGCNLGDSQDHRNARACLVRMGIETGGPDEILRQVLASHEQGKPLGYSRIREWPEDALAGLVEQGILKTAGQATALHCGGCEAQPLCAVQFRQEGPSAIPFIGCPNCGQTAMTPTELAQYRLDADGFAAFLVRELRLNGSIVKANGFWELGTYRYETAEHRVFLVVDAAKGQEVGKALENETGLCFTLSNQLENPDWIPNGLVFLSLRRELRIAGKRIYVDTDHISTVFGIFLKHKRPALTDEFGNARPDPIRVSGNIAGRDKVLAKTWKEYLAVYSPLVQVYLFEKEIKALDWQQAQRARFIFPGTSPETQYNRHLQKLREGALSGSPAPEGGWFPSPYRKKRADKIAA